MLPTLVCFHAHPDDESLLTAGTMSKAAAAGHRVVLVTATAGEVGDAADTYRASGAAGADADLGGARTVELEASAKILSVDRVELLGYRDSGSDGSVASPTGGPSTFASVDPQEAAQRLADILRAEDAAVLTVYDPNGGYGHVDHLRVHEVGYRAAALAGTPVVLEATINRDLMSLGVQLAGQLGVELPANFTPESFDGWFLPESAITHAIDVNAQLPQKRASMQAHASQATSSGTGVRSIARFLDLPDEYFALAFGTEWYVQRGTAVGDPKLDSVFATLDGTTHATGGP